MLAKDCVPLVEVTRGEIVESIHFGAFIVVDSHGNVLASEGNPDLMTYPRSSMKPFQALPFIERGGAEKFGLTEQEISIMCASHSGTDLHKSVLEGMHVKIGISEADLACGVHWPSDAATRDAMKAAGEEPTPFRHNCSGKHTGMLAHATLRGLDKEDYLNPDHPVQVTIRETLAEMVDMKPDEMPLGRDGCSAPVYGIPLLNMARGVAKMADPVQLEAIRAESCRKITHAMMSYPVMVAGPGKFDTDLMTAGKGKVFCKGGAEGYQIIGVMPGVLGEDSPGLGIAIKISDGDSSTRARASVSLTILQALGVLGQAEMEALSAYGNLPVKNWRGFVVGEIRPAFTLSSDLQN
ncbi:MAG: asparaginase [Anaerolineaceae bacterium]|nr:asparaginase [Anaerolineaceae bacterium]